MVWGYRYIDIDADGRVSCAKDTPTAESIDTEGMEVPAEPTDAIYSLHYSEAEGLHWVKVMEFDEIPPTAEEEQAAQMAYLVMKAKGATA